MRINKFKGRIAIFVCILFAAGTAYAQKDIAPSTAGKKTKEIKGTARNAMRLGDSYTALFYYKEWASRDTGNSKIIYKVAELFRETRNYAEAETWYKKLPPEDVAKFPESLFHLGQVQMSLEKYEDAKASLLKFKKESKSLKDNVYKKLVSSCLSGCDYALSLKDSASKVIVVHLDTSINKQHVEFSPVVIDENTILYGSLRDEGVNYYDVEFPDSALPLRKFYLAKKENDQWVSKGDFRGPFNIDHANVGDGAFSEDGSRFYFSVCNKNWQNKVICALYYSEKKNDAWDEPVKMNEEINLSNYTSTQPAVGRESKKNAEVLYFVSNRPGGKGGMDIWYSEYDKRKKIFRKPKNAGTVINTSGTEFTPFYDLSSHTLYYSTDGKAGFGGLDVFKTHGEKNEWDSISNLNKGINSPADDIGFALAKDHKSGFIVSNRKGGIALLNETCCDDIYEFKKKEFVNVQINGKTLDSANCLGGYDLFVYIKEKGGKDKYLSEKRHVDSCLFNLNLEPGNEYSFEVKKEGYFNSSMDFSTKSIVKSQTSDAELHLKKIPDKPIVLPGILYEFKSAELTPGAKLAIDTSLMVIMEENPEIIIQLSSHTDSKGTDDYNLKLSKRRAASVVKYMIQKGVNEKRLRSEGYGETRPVATNEHSDGTDNPEGRALNRRTEFQIVGKLTAEETEAE